MSRDTVPNETAMVKIEPSGLVRPAEVLAMGAAQAKPLADFIKQQKLSVRISGREYVRAEGWTCLARMNGAVPRELDVVRLDDGTYIATVALVRVSDQVELTRASAECGPDEPAWANRHNYARRSMAITRATAKVCRIGYSWILAMSGYEVTPAEEVTDTGDEWPRHEPVARAPRPAPKTEVIHDAETVDPENDDGPFTEEHPVAGPAISDKQLKLLFAKLYEKYGKADVGKAKAMLENRYAVPSLDKIPALKFNEVLAWIESQGAH